MFLNVLILKFIFGDLRSYVIFNVYLILESLVVRLFSFVWEDVEKFLEGEVYIKGRGEEELV